MNIKTSELTGAALDWAVAKCEGWDAGKYMMSPDIRKDVNGAVIGITVPSNREYIWWRPSRDWSQGGPIIERECILTMCPETGDFWDARKAGLSSALEKRYFRGLTPLIAAMRCYVASKLGDTIDIPEELIK